MSAREPVDLLAAYLRMQGFRVLTMEFREARRGRDRRVKVLTLEDRRGFHHCRVCGRRQVEGTYQETDPVYFRDSSLGDLETYLEVYPWRVACCDGTHRERFPFEMPGHRMTRRFCERVAALCTRLPVGEVAKMAGLSWDTAARVDKRAIELALGGRQPSFQGLRWLGIDEVSRTGGHDYFTIVTDLESERVVFIGDGKGEKGLKPCLDALGRRGRRRIRGTTSDLGYLPLLQEALPKATHLLDRFHIVKWLNEALKQLRRRIFGGAPRDATGRELKVQQWLLLSAPENLEHKHKLRLARLVSLNEPLYRAYLLKEQLRQMLHHPWRYTGHCAATSRPGTGGPCAAACRRWLRWRSACARTSRPSSPASCTASSSGSWRPSTPRSPVCGPRRMASAIGSTSSSRSSSAAACLTTLGRGSSCDPRPHKNREEPPFSAHGASGE